MKIEIALNSKSIANAIQMVNQYKSQLNQKVLTFTSKLADVGLNTVNSIMASVPQETGSWYNAKVEPIIGSSDKTIGCAVKLTGNQVLFIEFSSGVTYGTQYYPLPSGDPYGAGTYPSEKHHWSDPNGWWYPDSSSPTGYTHTFGYRAYMPMYHATEAMILEVSRIASEVFGFE